MQVFNGAHVSFDMRRCRRKRFGLHLVDVTHSTSPYAVFQLLTQNNTEVLTIYDSRVMTAP
jgi:hypothetical protein